MGLYDGVDRPWIVCVGVTFSRYVSLQHARPWLVHSYRNIKGRGLHVEEENSNVLPLEQAADQADLEPIREPEKDHPETTPSGLLSPASEAKLASATTGPIQASTSITVDTAIPDKGTADNASVPDITASPDSRSAGDASTPDIADTTAATDAGTASDDVIKTPEQDGDIGSSSNKRKLEDADMDTESANMSSELPRAPDDGSEDITQFQDKQDRGIGTRSRHVKKRRMEALHPEPSFNKEPPKVSTYDRVRLIIQPWRKPEGGINKPIFKMMLESIMLFFMMKPGSGENSLIDRYKPYLQPMVLKKIVQILIDIGCLIPRYIKKHKVSLFSECIYEEKVTCYDDEDVLIHYLPAEDCLFKLGQFGKAMFPNVKWPETTVLYG